MKPLKATQVTNIYALNYPLAASPKYDGIRAITTHKGFLSNSLKPLPNKQLQSHTPRLNNIPLGCYLDGELTLENPVASFNEVQSVVMSQDSKTKLVYNVFDCYLDADMIYLDRFQLIKDNFTDSKLIKLPFIRYFELSPTLAINLVKQATINNPKELLNYEHLVTSQGYEGVMLRSFDGIYKHGRSTLKEGYLLKLKKFKDSEALVVGFNELFTNTNEPTINELGNTARSHKQAGRIPANTLGSITLEHHSFGQFNCGSGFTQEQRKEIWLNQSTYTGKQLKFKYLDCSIKNKPRHPVFLGFRDPLDISN